MPTPSLRGYPQDDGRRVGEGGPGRGRPVEILLSLSLPRDADSVPVARHIVRRALAEVGVTDDCTHDVELALSEACSNVLLHSGPGREYDVRLELDE